MPYVQPWPGVGIKSTRRYYLLRARRADIEAGEATGDVFRAKQLAQPGTALPADFPHLARLQGCHYFAIEDLDGADANELRTVVRLQSREAQAVLSELAELISA